MAKHLIMNHNGHDVIEFDKTNDAAVQEAMDRFCELVGTRVVTNKNGSTRLEGGQGYTAATRKAGETDYTMIRDPNDQQDETLFIPQMRGG